MYMDDIKQFEKKNEKELDTLVRTIYIQKKRTCCLVDFVVPAGCRVKIKESKNDQILRPCRKTKKLWNTKVKVIPTVIGALGTVPKDLK